jgi:peptidoglycan hydrolase-like protein with peptidoglycan-binding domain
MPAAEQNSLQEVSSTVYPKLERVPGKQNWVDRAGGLPNYIERIAKHLHYEKGKDIGTAIAIAVNTVKKWSTGVNHNGSKLKPDTVAKAQKAVAEWMAKRGKSKLSEATSEDDSLVLGADEVASLVGDFRHRLSLAEGMAMGLKGRGTKNRAARVASALALVEGGARMQLGRGNADSRELARAQSMLGQEIADLRVVLEALGVPPLVRPEKAGPPAPGRRGPQAKGRSGAPLPFDEGKHPRAGRGQPTGGQFIRSGSSGPEVKGVQRAVGAKPDGRFGLETKKKVEAFQKQKGLSVDGVVGSQTAGAINGTSAVGGPLLAHQRSALRKTRARFTAGHMAAEDAAEKARNKANKARKEAKKASSSSSSSSKSSNSASSSTSGSANGGAGSVFGESSSLPTKVADLIQRKLGIATSGSYDEKTKARVEEFQRNHGLEVDGIVGTQTLAALRGDKTPPAPGAFTQSDWDWLTQHQAGGQQKKRHQRQAQHQEVREQRQASKRTEKQREEERARIERERKREEKMRESILEAVAQDDFHRKYGAGMNGQPDEATGFLQNRLAELGYDAGANDGRYGEKTQSAVAEFQRDHGLKDDGEVGSATKVALRGTDPEEVSKARQKASGVDEEDAEEAGAPPAPEGDEGENRKAAAPAKAKPEAKSKGKTEDGEAPPKEDEGANEELGDAEGEEDEDTPSLASGVLTKGTGVADEEPDASVKHLQKTIGAEVDGRFGPETERKVKAVQRRYGLKADGVVGPKTGRLLDRMSAKEKPKKDSTKAERELNEAVLRRMAAKGAGDTGAYVVALAAERSLRQAALVEASLRGLFGGVRDFYRLADGTFAPKGRGQILKPGEKINLPHRSGSGKVSATVEHSVGGRGIARINDGPEKGALASVRTAAPAGSKARHFPEPPARRSPLPPGDPNKAAMTAEVVSQNHLDHINDAIARGDDGAVQDHLDDMSGDRAWADKSGYGAANRNYDLATERGERFLRTGDAGAADESPQRALIDFHGASNAELDSLISDSVDANGLPKSGRDRSVFLTAIAEKKRRAKLAFDNSRSSAAKEAASNDYAQVTGERLMPQPAVQYAPPEGYAPNAGEKSLKEMSAGDTFYVGKHDQAYVWHKPTSGDFIVAKPVDGGKAKVFHREFAPPFIGPSNPNGSPSSSAPTPAPAATNDDALYSALKGSLENAGMAPSSPARSKAGNLRNFKAMSDEKLLKLAVEMKSHPDDTEAIKAITAELSSRSDSQAKKTAELKAPKKAVSGKSKEEKIASAWAAYEKKKADFDNLPADADKQTKAKAAAQVRAAKFRIKRVGGDPNKKPEPADKGPVVVKQGKPEPKGTPIPPPPEDIASELDPATTHLKGMKNGDAANFPNYVTVKKEPHTGYGSEKKNGIGSSYVVSQNGQTVGEFWEPDEAAGKVKALQAEDVSPTSSDTPSPAENTKEKVNLLDAADQLGDPWTATSIGAALDKLETQGIVFDRENEKPSVIAAVIKAANLSPSELKTAGTV